MTAAAHRRRTDATSSSETCHAPSTRSHLPEQLRSPRYDVINNTRNVKVYKGASIPVCNPKTIYLPSLLSSPSPIHLSLFQKSALIYFSFPLFFFLSPTPRLQTLGHGHDFELPAIKYELNKCIFTGRSLFNYVRFCLFTRLTCHCAVLHFIL